MKKTLLLSAILFYASSVQAALSSNIFWQVKKGATSANANGGGFDWGSAFFMTDLSDQGSTANTASPVVGSPSYVFVSSDVGHWVFVSTKTGGTWIPGFYQITSVSASSATLNATSGSSVWISTITGSPFPRVYPSTSDGIATTANPTGGTFGVDYSQSTGPIVAFTDIAISASTNTEVTSAALPFTKSHTGNILHILSGGTTYWIGITSVTAAGVAVLEKSAGTVGATGITANLGGAISLNSTTAGRTDDLFFESARSDNQGAHRFFISSGTYTTQNISIAATALSTHPIVIEGYGIVRGDRPSAGVESSSAPILSFASGSGLTLASEWDMYNVTILANTSPALSTGVGSKVVNVRVINNSTTSGRSAISLGSNSFAFGCEGISYRGNSVGLGDNTYVVGSHLHSSRTGVIGSNGTNGHAISGNLIHGMTRAGIEVNASAQSGLFAIIGNTIFGHNTPISVNAPAGTRGILSITGTFNIVAANNIIDGFTFGVVSPDDQTGFYSDYNNYYNNTVIASSASGVNNRQDYDSWQLGVNDRQVNPSFVNVTEITGTTAAFVAANSQLVDTSKDFTALGVYASTPSAFYVYISSGTGVTNTQMYVGITGVKTTTNPNDTLTLDTAQGTSTVNDKEYVINVTRDFRTGSALKGTAYPSVFPGGVPINSLYQGAVQLEETGGGGGTRGSPIVQ